MVLKQKATPQLLWAGACAMLGLMVGSSHPMGLLLLAGAVIFVIRGFRASQGKEFLRIDEEGLTYQQVFRERRVAWADIEAVKVLTYRFLGLIPYRRMVVLRFVPGSRGGALRKAAGWINGWDEMLPGNFGVKAKVLAALIEEGRLKALAGMKPASRSLWGTQTSAL